MVDNLGKHNIIVRRLCVFCNEHRESVFHLSVHCPGLRLLWTFIQNCLGVKGRPGRPGSLKAWWTGWRKKRVKHSIKMLWDMYMTALIWVVWPERTNRIFNQKSSSVNLVLDSIISFAIFWAGNLKLPTKRKVDASVLTYCRKRMRNYGAADNAGVSTVADDGSAVIPFVSANIASDADRSMSGQLVLFTG